jgi:uncharacterized protein YcgL (UPF0745 family)
MLSPAGRLRRQSDYFLRCRAMHAYVYKSLLKPDVYLYLRERDAFALVPDGVRLPLGKLQFVLEVGLDAERKLARENVLVVMQNLRDRGFHLQRPENVLDPLVAGGVGDG